MIKIGNYVIRKCDASHKFNLFEKYSHKCAKDPSGVKVTEKYIAFGIDLPECVHKITLDMVMDREEVDSLAEAVDKYERASREVVEQLKEISSQLLKLKASPEEEVEIDEEDLSSENYED